MRIARLVLIVALGLAPALTRAEPARVEVSYAPEGRFIDAGETQRDIERTEAALTRHLQSLGTRWLPAGATLKVVVTEIDLAGRVPMSQANRPRVLTGGADWPRIALRYEVTRPDGSVDRGQATLSDMSYLMRTPPAGRDDPLPYERRMLEDWFRGHFEQPGAARG